MYFNEERKEALVANILGAVGFVVGVCRVFGGQEALAFKRLERQRLACLAPPLGEVAMVTSMRPVSEQESSYQIAA